jgi:hypothetical protein
LPEYHATNNPFNVSFGAPVKKGGWTAFTPGFDIIYDRPNYNLATSLVGVDDWASTSKTVFQAAGRKDSAYDKAFYDEYRARLKEQVITLGDVPGYVDKFIYGATPDAKLVSWVESNETLAPYADDIKKYAMAEGERAQKKWIETTLTATNTDGEIIKGLDYYNILRALEWSYDEHGGDYPEPADISILHQKSYK